MVNISDIYTLIFDAIWKVALKGVYAIKKKNSKYRMEMDVSPIEMDLVSVKPEV